MGNLIKSKCMFCGFSNEFNFGGVKLNYKTNCPVPAINKHTLEFENINYYEYKKSNNYLFYHEDSLKGKNQDNQTIDNFNLKLNQKRNFCPSCKENSLTFEIIMFTD